MQDRNLKHALEYSAVLISGAHKYRLHATMQSPCKIKKMCQRRKSNMSFFRTGSKAACS